MDVELKYFQFGLRLDLEIRSNGEQMFEFNNNNNNKNNNNNIFISFFRDITQHCFS